MRTQVRQALNFQALVVASGGSEAKAIEVFDRAVGEFDTSEEFSIHQNDYARLLGVSSLIAGNAYLKCRPAFEAIKDDVSVLTWEDAHWPKRANGFAYCPRFIFVKGDSSLLDREGVSVIGTRNPSLEGRNLCSKTVVALGSKGYVITSGLALGIDGVAHRTALSCGFPTMAIIGTPLTVSYPPEHKDLQQQIAVQGCLVSRFSPALSVQKWFFLLRNRLMSSLSLASVVIEDRDGGGAVRQAAFALEQNKLVFIYQSTVDNPSLLWPRQFARKANVVVVRQSEDIVKYLCGQNKAKKPRTPAFSGQLTLF